MKMIAELDDQPIPLEAVLSDIWSMLRRGAKTASDPFHCPVLGTVGASGCSLRTVVLRRVLAADRMLLCNTDRRSRKVAEIARCPEVSWLFYHPQAKVQLRIDGGAVVHADDELADRQWDASALMSRRCYLASDAPGTVAREPCSGLPEAVIARSPTAAEAEIGRPNFVVIACRVTGIDWLYLKARGHLRARFRWNADDELHATWLTP
jgi:3-hydroxyisobutyrate dehydrogenase